MRLRTQIRVLLLAIVFGLLAITPVKADEVYGRISGTVTDPSGAIVPGATVKETDVGTGISKEATTGSDGSFQFIQLTAPGEYSVSATAGGFKKYEASGIHLNVGQIYVLTIPLEVGSVTQQVVVEASVVQVEQTSMELGTNLTSRDITELPLLGRNWVQLQQTLPGTVAATDRFGNYGSNGSRSQFNSFLINGTDNNDFPLNVPSYTPSPDAIGEVHIITNTMNPEYGRDSGAVLNAVTKSGTNRFHGDGFEFYRDTGLNTRNFFQSSASIFHQNLFGGTIGGPVWKNHTFFFVSYQANRVSQPETTGASQGNTPVFTADQRNGVFPSIATVPDKNGNPIPNPTPSPFAMVGEDGATHPAGTPYGTLFPTGHIQSADLNALAVKLMTTYVPLPNLGTNYTFQPTTASIQDQVITRVDHNFGTKDSIWGYFDRERDPSVNFLPFTGASLPGFGSTNQEHFLHGTLAWNHTFGGTSLNETRFGYNRFNYVSNYPQTPVLPSSAGFNITPQFPDQAGLPVVALTGYFTIGFSTNGPQPRIDQTYQFNDNFSKIHGNHSFKMGFETRRMQVYNPFLSSNSGNFTFGGAGQYSTGDAGADFLLGIPDQYAQDTGDIIDARSKEYGAYFQDQFKVRPNLTMTYGVNWDDDLPITDIYHKGQAINCWVPGQQSKVFPTAPVGVNYPGDPNCTSSGYNNHPAHFGPKIGFAWSPSGNRLTGGQGKTSVRAGYGTYFNRTEEEATLQNLGAPPWGLSSLGIGDVNGSPSFANPWKDVSTGATIANKFPYANPQPGANFNFGNVSPFYVVTTDRNFTVPYTYNYNLVVQRELPGNMIASVGYVGSESRKLHGIYNLNFDSNPAACAAIPDCVSKRSLQKLYYPQFARYANTPNTGVIGIGSESTFLNSNYNSLQFTANKRVSHGLSFLASYTWSHNLDYASSLEDNSFGGLAFDPTNFQSNYGNSALDARHRFTVSYVWDLPKVKSLENNFVGRRVVNGWEMAGVTTFQTGFPVQIYESTYRELRCDGADWAVCPDRPNQIASIQITDPRTAQFQNTINGRAPLTRDHYWFNPNSFALEPIGTVGDVGRNPFHGPGINNFNWSMYKNIPIVGESKYIQLRFEFYNLFNHTQFNAVAVQSAASNIVTGNAASSSFGRLTTAFAPRLVQLAAKIYF